MENNESWSAHCDRLSKALAELGYPEELGNVIASHIGSPKGIDRMISYLEYVRPDSMELIADEMFAIRSNIDRWREKKESEHANAAYNEMLYRGLDDDE